MSRLLQFIRALPGARTPSGAAGTTASLVVLILGLLNGWSWWAHQSTAVQTAAGVVLVGMLSQLAAWWNVVRQPGQKTTLELTPSALPTVQVAPADPAPAAPKA